MLLLGAPFDPRRAGQGRGLEAAALRGAVPLLALAGLGWAGSLVPGWPGHVAQAGASAAVHAAFITAGWILALGDEPGWRAPAWRLAAALLGAAAASRLEPRAAFLYLMPPGLLLRDGLGRPPVRAIGLGWPRDVRALALGLAAGGFLGVHLLVSASMTLGYSVRIANPGEYLAALAYDVGANAVSSEWLFRGALFTRWWRRWSFWPAAALSTLLAVARYLLDPVLPHALEVAAGAVFYTGLLGLSACALRAWSGSLLPGYLATVAFFAAYRTLGQ
jgi:hypothetical protein